MASKQVGLIGLGLLGTAMATRLLGHGFRIVGFDIAPDQCERFSQLGGEVVTSAGDVARECERVLLSLPTSDTSRSVMNDVQTTLPSGRIIIDTTTGHPDEMADIADSLAPHGIVYLDASVGGSSAQAECGDIVITVGGDRSGFESCRDLFDVLAREAHHVGPAGYGARMKLVVNLVLGLNRAVLAEGLQFARAGGLDQATALRILQAGPAWSRAMDTKGTKMIDQNFEPQARLAQHLKDVELILETGAANNARLPLSRLHRELLTGLVERGFGDVDNSAIVKAFDD